MKKFIATLSVFCVVACAAPSSNESAQDTVVKLDTGGSGGLYEGDYPGMGDALGVGGSGGATSEIYQQNSTNFDDEEAGLYASRSVCDFPPSLCEEKVLSCVEE